MKEIRTIIQDATKGICFDSYKYCTDEELKGPAFNFEEFGTFTILKDRYGETDTSLKETKDIRGKATQISKDEPLFKYFLDGSRRTYKVDDIEIGKRIFPIMAGQIGVACTERHSPSKFTCVEIDNDIVLVLPTEANPEIKNGELFFNNLKDKLNKVDRIQKIGLKFSKILSYSSKKNSESESQKYEQEGIVEIQNEMIDSEKKIVSYLTTKNLLDENNYLLKDGSLQYKPIKTGEYKELSNIKNNYRWVVGVSKLFNPEFSKDKNGKSNAALLAKLPLYHRTPAYMFQHERSKWDYFGNFKYSVWYVRIRDSKYTETPFSGVLKIEKILITEEENEKGLQSDLIDVITANVINERNPVSYGRDNRWANHLYPIYLTELYIKSKYLSNIHFLNLF